MYHSQCRMKKVGRSDQQLRISRTQQSSLRRSPAAQTSAIHRELARERRTARIRRCRFWGLIGAIVAGLECLCVILIMYRNGTRQMCLLKGLVQKKQI